MKGSHAVVCLVLVCAVVLVSGTGGLAGLAKAPQPEGELGTAFTYQGRLTDGGNPAEGAYDFQFRLYDAPSGGNLLGTVTPGDVAVSGGLFTVNAEADGLEAAVAAVSRALLVGRAEQALLEAAAAQDLEMAEAAVAGLAPEQARALEAAAFKA